MRPRVAGMQAHASDRPRRMVTKTRPNQTVLSSVISLFVCLSLEAACQPVNTFPHFRAANLPAVCFPAPGNGQGRLFTQTL